MNKQKIKYFEIKLGVTQKMYEHLISGTLDDSILMQSIRETFRDFILKFPIDE